MQDPRRLLLPALFAGLLAGTLDIVFACTYWALAADVSVHRVLQSVAAGLLGARSFQGGTTAAALGLALHFAIAVAMAAGWFVLARRWPPLVRRPLAWGAAYGLLLYLLMRFVVVPLSAAPGGGGGDTAWTLAAIAAHVLLVGMPIAWLAARAMGR